MKKINFFKYALLSAMAIFVCSCSDDDDINTGDDNETVETVKADHIVARFNDDDSQVYITSTESLTEGSLTFDNNGHHLDPSRSARVFTDDLGWVYMFDYGGGYLKKLSHIDGLYDVVREVNIAPTFGGNANVRPWKINEQTILIHNINVETITDGNGDVVAVDNILMYVTRTQIPELAITEIMDEWEVPTKDWDTAEDAYPFRIDAPCVMDNKIYYGVGRRQLGANPPAMTGMHTITLDYPSLTNPEYIRSEKGNGNTNGYRGINMHVIDGYVYQANSNTTEEDATILVRLKDGQYDNDWEFNVTEAIGEPIRTNKWDYIGDGIAYMSVYYFNEDNEGIGSGEDSPYWGLIKIDINAKTAEKIDVPLAPMFAYQKAKVEDGKYHIAISPLSTSGDKKGVYIVDIATNEVTFGLELDQGNMRAEGIF